MKRDMELVRLLLLSHETDQQQPELESYPRSLILYNYRLMADKRLIEARFAESDGVVPGDIAYIRLTWDGHDFLDSTRDSQLWKRAKEKVLASGASWTFDILKEWLKCELKQKLGLPIQ